MTATIPGYSRQQAALKLGVSPMRVDQLGATRRLPFVQTSLGRLYDPETVDRLAAQRRARQRTAPFDDSPQAA